MEGANSLAREIGTVIVRLRKMRHLSQEQLSLEAGIDRRYMSDIENGKRRLSCDMLNKIAEFFNLSLSDIFDFAAHTWKLDNTTDNLRDMLVEQGYEETIILENPSYLSAIAGLDEQGRLIYSYQRMVKHLMLHDSMEYEEACEFIDFNTVRAMPYMGENAPVIVYDLSL